MSSASTFKTPVHAFAPHCRPPSPTAPAFEPLSPPRPREPAVSCPPGPWPPAAPAAATAVAPRKPADGDVKTPAAAPRSAAPARKHRRAPSTINDLAEAALATSPTQPAHPQPYPLPRKTSAGNVGDALPQHTPQPAPQYPSPAHHAPSDSVRAAKRARSDVGPSPLAYPFAARPSTGSLSGSASSWSYNVEQGIDRARRQSTNTNCSNPLEDAELLLNFAARVQPRPARPCSPVREAPLHQSAPPSALAPSAFSPQLPPQAPAATTSVPPEDPAVSLPSPQGTNEDDKSLETDRDKEPVVPASADHVQPGMVEPPYNMLLPQQTQTPPEEEQHEESLDERQDAYGMIKEDLSEGSQAALADGSQSQRADSPKARPRRGWPKGKPRGPRNKSASTVKPRSAAKRSRASVAKSTVESGDTSATDDSGPATVRRRKSMSDLTVAYAPIDRVENLRSSSVPLGLRCEIVPARPKSSAGRRSLKKVTQDTVCAGCAESRQSTHGELDQWISCNGCKEWFHYDCAGFRNERDVRDIDKFFCKTCEPEHGPTTFVRKSSRTHTNVDYSSLNQGILKTSDDDFEHHYIQPIKDGTLKFDQETFPRMRPELATREYFETCSSFSEPVLIPAEFNPRPQVQAFDSSADVEMSDAEADATQQFQDAEEEEWMTKHFEFEIAREDGEDRLGMVIPQGLTVRLVADIVGPDETLDVIDVKTQGTEGRWNLRKWADYYEAEGEKSVRNVISLEVSDKRLGKLLRRPKVVRDIDLQDSVWPQEELAKGNYPKVQFYCLMSVADSYTDFHIDFGGSSVYYHILRGKKTFFFIPPTSANLKAYQDWNDSPEQNFTWLPRLCDKCYRVDLSEGDTMLIPSGWIHAVWTPENSLVIGGNFLTRMHYSNQFRVFDIEKANKTAQKFRYPHFQKVMWYAVIKYLELDPLPMEIAELFYSGDQFRRERPIWADFDEHGVGSRYDPGTPGYNARYYSQAELDGLPELINFIFRTVMVSLGRIEGVSEDARKRVMRSIPKSSGEPLELARIFALWVAWKRGNEDPPAWAHPDADLPDKEGAVSKKLSARALKQLQRQEAFEAWKIAPDRVSARQQASREVCSAVGSSPAPSTQAPVPQGQHTSTPKTSVLGPKRIACDACRKRRIRCKHKDVVTTTPNNTTTLLHSTPSQDGFESTPMSSQRRGSRELLAVVVDNAAEQRRQDPVQLPATVAPVAQMVALDGNGPALVAGNALLADPNSKRGRSKACLDCRKSKRRCVHDENGKIDPIKAEQTPVPRGTVASKKRRISGDAESPTKKPKQPRASQSNTSANQVAPAMPFGMAGAYQSNAITPTHFKQQSPYPDQHLQQWQQSSYMYPDPGDVNNGPYHQPVMENHVPYNLQSLEQLANEVLDSRYVNDDEDGGYTMPQADESSTQPAMFQVQAHGHFAQQAASQQRPHHSTDSGVVVTYEAHPKSGAGILNGEAGQEMQPQVESKPGYAVLSVLVNDSHTQNLDGQGTIDQTLKEVTVASDQDKQLEQGSTQVASQVAEVALAAAATDSEHTITTTEVVASHLASPPRDVQSTSPELTKSDFRNIPLYQPPVAKRRASLSKTPAPLPAPEHTTPSSARRQRDNKSVTPNISAKSNKASQNRERANSSLNEMDDEESLRLARALQDQDWGLRSRRSK
ncbi:hypothetical protein MBLNU459_g4481t2 [Dothideomycetes sp. NU459]